MTLDLQESARLLGVSPETLRRWARQGHLGIWAPGGELRFERAELEAWARRQGIPLHGPTGGRSEGTDDGSRPFRTALERGGFVEDLAGPTPKEVLTALVAAAPLAPGADPDRLLRLLFERERLGSTGLGHGVALPHPRTPDPSFAERPTVVLGRLRDPVDWSAIDGEPVRTVFLLLNPNPSCHLKILARVALLLRDPDFRRLLAGPASAEEILAAVERLEPPEE
ncbi:MAG: helix-turn-helix domain-containing protein [Planctomycetota bacterium]|nr:MAG: helix-turn-helix domain-containing protein [Planctomycetota bacterium]